MKKHLFWLGLFIATLTVQLSAQTVYITNTGEKYHNSACRYLSRSKNAIELKEALSLGYDACKVCKPPREISASRTKEDERVNTKQPRETQPDKDGQKQCHATTQKGARCKRITSSSNGKCWQHGGN